MGELFPGEDPFIAEDDPAPAKPDLFFGHSRGSLFRRLYYLQEAVNTYETWRFLYLIGQYLMPLSQSFSLAFVSMVDDNWRSPYLGWALRATYCLITFSPVSKAHEFVLASFLIVFISNLLIFCCVSGTLIYLRTHKRLSPIWQGVLFFEIEFLSSFVAYPASRFVGLAVCELTADFTSITFLLFTIVLAIIPGAAFLASFLYGSYFVGPSPSIIASVDGKYVSSTLLLGLVETFLTSLTTITPDWFPLIPVSIGLVSGLISLLQLQQMQFLHSGADSGSAAFSICVVVSDTLNIIHWFVGINEVVRAVVPTVAMIVSYPLYDKWHKAVEDAIVAKLQAPELYGSDPDAYIESLGADTYEIARMYVSVGFTRNCHCIYDGTLLLPLAEKFDGFMMWYYAAGILSMIPAHDALFQRALARLKEHAGTSVIKQMFVVRFALIADRRSEASLVFRTELEAAKRKTDAAVRVVREFWETVAEGADAAATRAFVSSLASALEASRTRWGDLLGAHEHNAAVLAGYARHLRECEGDCLLGPRIAAKSRRPNLSLEHPDPFFARFCRSKPEVLRLGFVDIAGRLHERGDAQRVMRSDSASDSSSDDDDSDDNADRDDSTIEQDQIAIFRATADYVPPYYDAAMIASTAVFGLWLLAVIVSIATLGSHVDGYTRLSTEAEGLAELGTSLNRFQAAFVLRWAREQGAVFEDTTTADLALAHSAISVYPSVYTMMRTEVLGDRGLAWARSVREVNETICREDPETNESSMVGTRPILVSRAVALLIWDAHGLWTAENPLNSTFFCHMTGVLGAVPKVLLLMFELVIEAIEERNLELRAEKNTMVIVEVVLMAAVFLPIIALPHLILERSFHKLTSALAKIPKRGALEAAQRSRDDPPAVVPGNLSRAVSWRILEMALFVAVAFLVAMPTYVIPSSCDQFLTIVDLMQYGSQRHPTALRVWNYATLSLIVRTHPIPFFTQETLTNTHASAVAAVSARNRAYIDGVLESTETFIALAAARSDEHCKIESCFGEVTGFDDFLERSQDLITNPEYNITSPEFTEFTNLLLLSIEPGIRESRDLDLQLCSDTLTRSTRIALVVTLLAAGLLVLLFVVDRYFHSRMIGMLQAAILLLRHVRPYWIANSPEMVEFFLPNEVVETEQSIAHLVVDHSAVPTVCLSEGFLIEFANAAFTATFPVSTDSIVGRFFDSFVPRAPASAITTWSDTDLYAGMGNLLTRDTGSVSTPAKIMVDGRPIPVFVKAFAVPSRAVVLVFIENSQERELMNANREALTRHAQALQIQCAHIDRTAIVPHAEVIAIELLSVVDIVSNRFTQLDVIVSLIEGIVLRSPPFRLWTLLFNTIYIVGVIPDENEANRSSISLALEIMDELARRIPSRTGGGFRVAIAGGMALQVILRGTLQFGTDAMYVIALLLAAGPPVDTLIVPRVYRGTLADRGDIAIGEGPYVGEINTILIASKRVGVRVSGTFDQPPSAIGEARSAMTKAHEMEPISDE
jgi:hypothetical protein